MPDVYIEPLPKGRPKGATIDGYTLKLASNARLVQETYSTQKAATDKAKSMGYEPLVARVRNTNKGIPDHWRSAE